MSAGSRRPLLLATRASPLALAQSRQAADLLEAATGVKVKLVPVVSSGGRRPAVGSSDDKSRFVRGVDDALLSGRADVAVHSAKDVPGERTRHLTLAAVPPRADARDALCGASSLASLPAGARVGTSSLRRRAQLLVARPDLEVVELHGNVDSRLRRLHDGAYAAIVLAAAGLERLGLPCDGRIETEAMVPAPGQGALMLEVRTRDVATRELVAQIDHAASARALQAERALAGVLGATCDTPFGAVVHDAGDELVLDAFTGAADGSVHARVRARERGGDPRRLARTALDMLQDRHQEALDAALGRGVTA